MVRKSTWILFFFCIPLFVSLTISGCGSGGSDPPPVTTVTIEGTVDDGTPTSPLANATCRFVTRGGEDLASAQTDTSGFYSLQVTSGVIGFMECTPSSLPDVRLITFVSTSNQVGDAILQEDVSPATTVIAMVVRGRSATNPQTVKTQLLNDHQAGSPRISVSRAQSSSKY